MVLVAAWRKEIYLSLVNTYLTVVIINYWKFDRWPGSVSMMVMQYHFVLSFSVAILMSVICIK